MSLFTKGCDVRLVRARNDYKCWACCEILPKGHKYAYHQCLDGKEIISTKFCEPCYVGLVSLCIELKLGVDDDIPPDIVEENKLKSGDTVKLLDDGCGWYDDGFRLKDEKEWKIIDINQKTTNGMYARIFDKDGKSTAYHLSHLIKVFKD